MKDFFIKLRQYLLTGVSYVIPFIACGGILIALSIATLRIQPGVAPDPVKQSPYEFVRLMATVGGASFTLALPVLAGFISYAIAGRPGLVPGFVGGFLCNQNAQHSGPGFLGAILIGLAAGWVVQMLKKLPTPRIIKPIMPILIIPLISAMFIGCLLQYVIGHPIAAAMHSIETWLDSMGKGNAVVLAMILGCMIAFDMGGPINKIAFFFGVAMIGEGNPRVMGCIAAAICTPPLGMGLATILLKRLWTTQEREAGMASLAMGMIGITEGAIPFAASDPLRVIPCICFGSATAAVIAMISKVADHAPHGGPIVLGVVDNRMMYVLAIIVGTLATALAINAIKILTRSPVPVPEGSS
jgi:fructose PTS system EIIBC or EIIC component